MPSNELRQSVLSEARRIVVKMGTQSLTGPDGFLDLAFLAKMAGQVHSLKQKGYEVTLVSSGAVGSGMAELGLKSRPRDIAQQQAVAAVGQPMLMGHWHQAFAVHGLKVAQLLLTRGDFDDRVRYLNIRNCVTQLHASGCVPVINENDTVAVDELRFGDNDMLAALMCNALRADVLVLLSVVDGLLDESGVRIDVVEDVLAVAGMVRKDKSTLGTGGMGSKLEAARLVTEAGEVTLIGNGREPDVLVRMLGGENVGTIFLPVQRGKVGGRRKLDSRQRWIGLTKRPAGTVTIDAGAAEALRSRGKSLLAKGVTDVTGHFDKGDAVLVRDAEGHDVARGLSNYSAAELRQIMGHNSSEFEQILGRPAYAEVIHRDNLVVGS